MSETVTMDGLTYALPLSGKGVRILDANGKTFMVADGPEQASMTAALFNDHALRDPKVEQPAEVAQ